MADFYYRATTAAQIPVNVTAAGTSDAAAPVELRVTYDATGADRLKVLLALDAIKARIIESSIWPPA